jgi:hypothetical protein
MIVINFMDRGIKLEKFLLGIDNGGTVIKAALFTLDGKELAVASRQTVLVTPHPGWTERDMEELWRQNCACIRQVITGSGVNPAAIAGIAVCGHGKGLYLWGKTVNPPITGSFPRITVPGSTRKSGKKTEPSILSIRGSVSRSWLASR